LPFSNLAPARTRKTRWGAFTARQRCWADSMSLRPSPRRRRGSRVPWWPVAAAARSRRSTRSGW